MKKFLFWFIITITAFTATNAQYFIEGSVGVSLNKSQLSNDIPMSENYFSVSPQVGYWLNDNIAAGIKVFFCTNNHKHKVNAGQETVYKLSNQELGISVFSRYKLYGTEKLSLLVESSIGVGGGSSKEKTKISATKKNQTTFMYGISAVPLVSYDLTEKFSLIATIDFLSLELISQTLKYEDSGVKRTFNRFGFNTQSTILSSLSNLRIGFIYNF